MTTQDDCKARFVAAMERLEEELAEIDEDTPWSDREPQWWCDMIDIRARAIKARSEHGK